MRYKNTKTGAIIDSPCKISGGDWIEEKKRVSNDGYMSSFSPVV